MKLYYSPLSVFSAKPRIAMYEKAIAHEIRLVNWTPATGWIKPEELPRLNPKAQIPVLVDGDEVVYDSTIILEYLEDRFPKAALFPAGAGQRAMQDARGSRRYFARAQPRRAGAQGAPEAGLVDTRQRRGSGYEGRARAQLSAARPRAGRPRVPVRRIQRRRYIVLLADQHRVLDGGRAATGVRQAGKLAEADDQPAERVALPGGVCRGHRAAASSNPGCISARMTIRRAVS